MVGSKRLPLPLSVAGWTSQDTAHMVPIHKSLLTTTTVLGLGSVDMMHTQIGLFSGWPFLHSVSVPFFGPVLHLDRNISGLKKL